MASLLLKTWHATQDLIFDFPAGPTDLIHIEATDEPTADADVVHADTSPEDAAVHLTP